MALATDFPRLWRDRRSQMKEKKRMLRLLIEDVKLTKGDALHVDIRFARRLNTLARSAAAEIVYGTAHH